jgi:hypothetical protein
MTASVLAGTAHETSVPWPAHQAEDRGLLLVEHGGGTVATPTGCAIVPGFPLNQGGGSILSAFDIVASGGSMPNLALAGGSNHMIGAILRLRDAHPTDPYVHFAGMKQSGANTNGTAPALKVDEQDLLMLMVAAIGADNLVTGVSTGETNADLTSLTEVLDVNTTSGDGGGLLAISGVRADIGIVGPWASTLTSTVFVAAVLAIRPKPIYTIAGNWQIAGAPAPNGTEIHAFDTVLKKIVASTTVTGGAGAYSMLVPYNTANRYSVLGYTGANFCASAKKTAA